MLKGRMSDSDAAFRGQRAWPSQGLRQRLGSWLERHVMRSAVDMLDERGAELDTLDRELQEREADLAERFDLTEAQEAEVEHRQQRLAELGVEDIRGQPRIDHLIRQLDLAEAALSQLRAEARRELATAHEKARELQARVRQLEEGEHSRLLTQADVTRREVEVTTREHAARDRDDRLRRREQEVDARKHGLLAHERRLAERERRVAATEADLRKRIDAVERRESEREEREDAVRDRDTGWWNARRSF
jgi:hypothetical protein